MNKVFIKLTPDFETIDTKDIYIRIDNISALMPSNTSGGTRVLINKMSDMIFVKESPESIMRYIASEVNIKNMEVKV